MNPTRTTLFDCPLDRISTETLLQYIHRALQGEQAVVVEGLNVAKLVEARRDPRLMGALHEADYIHCDGAGIALAARLLGIALPPRRAGIDLMQDMLALCVEQHAGVFLLGATPGIVAQAANRLQQNYPQLIISGTHHGYFDEADAPVIAARIAASGARLLLVGIRSPKKELFLQQYKQGCGVQVAMGVGGAFDVVAGTVARAPGWMQRHGLEWLFRLLQEPRRLGWRYLSTNSVFAGLLFRAWIMRKTATESWPLFLEMLQRHYTDAALAYRHEIYFLQRKKFGYARLHALAALLRDMFLLAMQKRTQHATSATHAAVVTLDGPSGYETIKRAMDATSQTIALIIHPRVRSVRDIAPARPRALAFARALVAGCHQARVKRNMVSRVIVACCAARHVLWQASWEQFHRTHPHITHYLLHNDFDMMSSSCVAALSSQTKILCLQHGIPTDEFFPTRAPVQIVWGESSKAVYASHAGTASLLIDAFERNIQPVPHAHIPQAIHLVSQTHTPVYGIALVPRFEQLARELQHQGALRILLHPQEVQRWGLYRDIAPQHIAAPPHAVLTHGAPCHLIVGYSSTALLDAAQAGHYVAAMDWPALASAGARAVCRPPVLCRDAAGVMALFRRLSEDKVAREEHQKAQHTWLTRTFDGSGKGLRDALCA